VLADIVPRTVPKDMQHRISPFGLFADRVHVERALFAPAALFSDYVA
jgi:hypothetical protein